MLRYTTYILITLSCLHLACNSSEEKNPNHAGEIDSTIQRDSDETLRINESSGVNKIVSPQEVARRAICLAAFITRAKNENEFSNRLVGMQSRTIHRMAKRYQKSADKINTWLKSEELWSVLSESEQSLMLTPAGQINRKDLINTSWRIEGLGIILWSLGKIKRISPYDTMADSDFLEKLPLFNSTKSFISNAEMISESQIRKARDVAEFWNWRSRTYKILLEPEKHTIPKDISMEDIIQQAAAKGEQDGLFKAIGNDFPAFNKPYRKVTESEWEELRSIAQERHYALNWLCGFASNWDEIVTDS